MSNLQSFQGAPENWTQLKPETLLSLSESEAEALQLYWAERRFHELRPRISALAVLAEKQGIQRIGSFDDLAKLLFTHQVYKNYPMEFVEKKRYAELTRWLGKLTTVDLSNVNMEGIKSLDEWLAPFG